jgi:hypothetical protein
MMHKRNTLSGAFLSSGKVSPPPVFHAPRRYGAALTVAFLATAVVRPEHILRPPVLSLWNAKSFRSRIRKSFAAAVILVFSYRMCVADIAGSKLSAVRPRQHGRRVPVACVDNLARGRRSPVASLSCRQAAAETVPVSAPFGRRLGSCHVAGIRAVGVAE